jgi:hypothetical protein
MHCRSLGLLAAGQEVDLLKHRSDPVARIDKLCCQAALPPSSQGQEPTPRLSGVQDRASAGRWGWCSRRTNSLRSVRWRQSIACRSSWPGVCRPVDVARRGQQRPRRSCDFFIRKNHALFRQSSAGSSRLQWWRSELIRGRALPTSKRGECRSVGHRDRSKLEGSLVVNCGRESGIGRTDEARNRPGRATQCVRMSSDHHQRYSTENQS